MDTDVIESERFELEERLGSGGMGVVYRAWDRVRNARVAVKMMRLVDGPHLYRFKREFRALADIVHPNLVELYELRAHGDEWFFSMELVDGVSFLEWVRPGIHVPREQSPSLESGSDDTTDTMVLQAAQAKTEGSGAPLDLDRLRAGLRQLVEGLHALHRAGKLHRDIKPRNVLVEPSGRVIICDFGLVMDTPTAGSTDSNDELMAGTPTYMAPEQAARGTITEASDWYSVGVLLYHCLTGRRPFAGSPAEILRRKQIEDAPPARSIDPSIPDDLDELCRRLLARDASVRPAGVEMLALVGGTLREVVSADRGTRDEPTFVGRLDHLDALRQAFQDSREGSTVALVHGRSGMGKTSLCRRFLAERRQDPEMLILAGRCYERESVPYKALDTIIDELSTFLLGLPEDEIAALLPRDVAALAKVFPVLQRVEAIAQPRYRALVPRDPVEVRRRAFRALRYLLEQLGAQRPVILFIDDLQWGDLDSAPFFFDIMQSGDGARVLLMATYRDEDAERSPLLRALRETETGDRSQSDIRDVEVGPLGEADAVELARALARQGDGDQRDEDAMVKLVRDTGGHPFLLAELMRVVDGRTTRAVNGALDLDDLLHDRVASLPADARRLITMCAVGGTPMSPALLASAAGVDGTEAALAALRAGRLISSHPGRDTEEIEPYHDRIRQAILARLSAGELASLHGAIARALEAAASPDAEALVEHWVAAGDTPRAARFAAIAAERAEDAFAFTRAARHYSLALKSSELEPEARRALLARLAAALVAGGRLPEAADTYLVAAALSDGDRALDLRRLACEQLLRAGLLQRGLDLATEVLGAVGVKLPGSRRRALAAVALSRAWLRLRGFGYRETEPDQLDEQRGQRLETFWSLASALPFVDPMLGTWCQMRYLRAALAAGAIHHVARGFTLELGYRSMPGSRARAVVDAWAERMTALAQPSGDAELMGLARSMKGLSLFLRGEWKESHELILSAEHLLLDEAATVGWNIDMCRIFQVAALAFMGRFAELARLLPLLIREAEEAGDEYLLTGLRGWRSNLVWLALDDPAEARRQASMATSSQVFDNRFHLHHYYELLCHAQIELYEGNASAAWERVTAALQPLERSMLLRVQTIRIEVHYLRARSALATAREAPERLDDALRSARALGKEDVGWAQGLAALIRGCLAATTGAGDARAELEAAASTFRAADMAMFAAVADRRLGELIGGEPGQQLVAASTAAMTAERIAAPDRFAALWAPLPSSTPDP